MLLAIEAAAYSPGVETCGPGIIPKKVTGGTDLDERAISDNRHLRFFTGSIKHESNTLIPIQTQKEYFAVPRGKDALQNENGQIFPLDPDMRWSAP